MSDINIQTFSGKVQVNNNLKVGSGHLFVDTAQNQVGLNTTNPLANLHVNGNTYVHSDLRVGSGIAMNVTSGRITAGSFEGDGSLLSGVNSDSGSWVNGSSSNIHLAVSTDNVGIGVLDPSHKLDVDGDINIASGSTLRVGGTPAVFSNWSVDGSDIYRSSGNVGIGTTSPNNSLHIYKNANERTSGLFIEKAEGGTNAAALFFGVNAPGENPGVAKAAIFYERNLVNGRGDIKFCNDASSDANNVTPETVDTRMIIKNNGNVGIGTTSPQTNLHIESSASTGVDIYGGDTSNPYIFIGEHQSTYSSKWGGKLTYYGDSNVRWLNISVVDANVETAAITVRRNGHVGVGTESPDTALHVNGVIKQTGANWALTNGGLGNNQWDGTVAGSYAYLNRSLGNRNNVTLTHYSQGGYLTRSRITVNQTGKYALYINGFKQVGTSSNAYELQLHKNGGYVYVRAYNGPSDPWNSYQTTGSAYTLMDLNANDYLEVRISSGTFHGNDSIYFSGHLIA
jgi:hypothetical protein